MSKRKANSKPMQKSKKLTPNEPDSTKTNSTIWNIEDNTRSFVCGWRNREEFLNVYNDLFGENSDKSTKSRAYDSMLIWKIRMISSTPASVSATLAILEAVLKDNMETDKETVNNLRNMYSNASTKFLNHITSIFKKEEQSMYKIAKSIEIDSFIVDLRHLCSHGQTTPSIEVLRRSATYSLNWIKSFYWDKEVETIRDTNFKDIKLNEQLYKNNLVKSLDAYDMAIEGIYKDCKTLADLEQIPLANGDNRLSELKDLAAEMNKDELRTIVDSILLSIVKRHTDINRFDVVFMHTFIEILFSRKFFKEITLLKLNKKWEKHKLSPEELFQDLFFFLSIRGYIRIALSKLTDICENDAVDAQSLKIASYWMLRIVEGFINFEKFKNKKFKNVCRKTNTLFKKDTVRIPDSYKKQNVKYVACDLEKSLLFAHSKYYWDSKIKTPFLRQRLSNINSYTKASIVKAMHLCDPPLSKSKYLLVLDLIKTYCNETTTLGSGHKNQCMTVKDVLSTVNNSNKSTDSNYGAWQLATNFVDWSTIPLGEII